MLLFAISAAVTALLLITALVLLTTREDPIAARLMEIAGSSKSTLPVEQKSLAASIASVTGLLGPIPKLITSNDENLAYRLSVAGYRKPEHMEVFVAAKLLLPLLGLVAATFASSNQLLIGFLALPVGYFAPDYILTSMISGRRKAIEASLPDALDLLVICMEAGLGIDQALVRVGQEMKPTGPALSEELQLISREQRAGKPRLEAWRSMSERVDLDVVRQFISMLAQTERFGTPVAHSLGQFADSLRLRRTQKAEERAAKTTIKLVFPLVLFILPALFVVLLGPAVVTISRTFGEIFK